MKFPYFTAEGTEDGERDYPSFMNFEKNKGVDALRQVILAIRSNKRQGSASTKTRAEVRGSGKKIHRQKGLGAGRVGDKNAVQRRGGGVVFGPKPRSYNKKVNRKTKRLALARALFDGATEGKLSLIEAWKVSEAKTKHFTQVINKVIPDSRRSLIVDDAFEDNFGYAARNVSRITLARAQDLSPLDLVLADKVIFSVSGLEVLLAKVGKEDAS
ncbi:MAG: 50S ribosomal protein L4 [Opitutales bacterium]|jgi:large subunit ribosomal protein L4|uniref:50S ribosomal protein L4 n=1 Tax=marine metagenome TaxID=408172 RepID=A0A382U3S7_9ZZZZ|nr:50S ribosomal protein L4 [Opitutales bacterium]